MFHVPAHKNVAAPAAQSDVSFKFDADPIQFTFDNPVYSKPAAQARDAWYVAEVARRVGRHCYA